MRAGGVLVVVSSRQRRGAEVFGRRLADGLTDRGWWTSLVALTDDDLDDPVPATPVAPLDRARAGRFSLRIARGLRAVVVASQPDVVVAFGGPTLRYVALALRRRRRPKLVYVSIGEPAYWIRTPLQRALYRRLLGRMDRCLAVTHATARQLVEHVGVPPHRVGVAPTGITPDFFEHVEPVRLGDPEEATRFVVIASLSPEKDPVAALDAFAEMSAISSSRLRFVGDGPLRPAMEAAVERRCIRGVEFTGAVADVRPHLAWADVLVLTSKSEGLPGVVVEAAAAGVPTVAYDVGGTGEAVIDGITGLLAPPGDAAVLRAQMKRLAGDRELRARLGSAARLHAGERFTIDVAVDRYHEELLAVIDQPPPKVAHLTTVDSSLRYLLLPQLRSVAERGGVAVGISAPGPDVPALEAAGIRHVALSASTRSFRPGADLRAVGQLWRALRRERPDVLHTHNPKPSLYGRIIARLLGVPVIVNTTHGLYATEDDAWPKRAVVYLLEAIAARCSDAELSQSREDFDFMRDHRITPAEKLIHLGNGIDLDRFDPTRFTEEMRRAKRAELGIDAAAVVVGTVGRLVAEKGYLELFEAFQRLGDAYTFVVVGPPDPSKSDALDEAAVENARRDGVIFLGQREDVDELYAIMDVFVLASHREGFPRAAMEAASMALPVVATDIRGCREVVDDGVNGRLVPVRDPTALATAVEKVTADRQVMQAMGRAGRLVAMDRFDQRSIVRRVLATYRRAARHRGHRRLDRWLAGVSGSAAVRAATRRDAPEIARLARVRLRRVERLLAQDAVTAVSEDGAGLNGFGAFAPARGTHQPGGVLVMLAVLAAGAHQEAASKLMSHMTAEAAERDWETVDAVIGIGDVTACRILERAGFSVVESGRNRIRMQLQVGAGVPE